MRWIFVNNEFMEEGKTVLKAGDMALQRGYGVFDFFRTKNNKPLFLDDYLDRFYNSAREMFITVSLTRDELKKIISTLMEKNNLPESGIRITATGGYSPDDYIPVQGNVIIQQKPLILPPAEKYEKGMKIITHEYLRDLPAVKSINYLMGVWLQRKVKALQADDVLYVKNNIISEFPRSNIFIVTKKGELLTPGSNVLAGITRKKLLELSKDVLPTLTPDVTITELRDAAEVFMTSTTKRILPVVQVNDTIIGNGKPGKITSSLYELFIEMEQKEN